MKFSVETTPFFIRQFKYLFKKYPSLKKDLFLLEVQLAENPTLGDDLGKNCYKIRLKISSKNKGKSGGARVITYVRILSNKVYLTSIYDKSEKESISSIELDQLLSELPE